MPSDDTRRLLKLFGVAVTAFEDAVNEGTAPEQLAHAAAEARRRLDEVAAFIERLEAETR